MSSFCKYKFLKLLAFSSKNIRIYAIFNDQSFNDTLTNDIVGFEQLGPGIKRNIWTISFGNKNKNKNKGNKHF